MRLKLTVELDVEGISRHRLLNSLWEEFIEEIDGKIADTYYLTDVDKDEEVEVEVSVEHITESK